MRNQYVVKISPFPFGRNKIAEKGFAPKFRACLTSAQSECAVVKIATIERSQDRFVGVINKNCEPFRSQFIANLDNSLVGLVDGTDQLNRPGSKRSITILTKDCDVARAPGLIPVAQHPQAARNIKTFLAKGAPEHTAKQRRAAGMS